MQNVMFQKTKTPNAPNPYLDYLIEPSFQKVNKLFVSEFNALDDRTRQSRYYLPTAKLKDYNVMIDGNFFFDQPIRNHVKVYENIWKLQLVEEMVMQLVVC